MLFVEANAIRARRRKIQRQVVAGNLQSGYVMIKRTISVKGRFASEVSFRLAGQRGEHVTLYGPSFPKFHDLRVWSEQHNIPMPVEISLPVAKKTAKTNKTKTVEAA